MHLKHMKSLLPAQDGASKILAACWSPNNKRLAICTGERIVVLFDENCERRDKFSTKPIEGKYGKKSYTIQGMAFSPDSMKLAIGQTDNIIYVYRLGEQWGEKKVISNKYIMDSPVTCLTWLHSGPLVHGLMNGKIRCAYVKTHRSATLYSHDFVVVSLANNYTGNIIISGHLDGALMKYILDESGQSGEFQGKIAIHSCSPSVLVWAGPCIFAAGCDQTVAVYDSNGTSLQLFDYTGAVFSEREFTTGACNPTGQTVVLGSFNKIRIYNFNTSVLKFEELKSKEVKNWYTITSMAWRKDGSKLAVGTLCGTLDLFDCHTKRSVYGNKLEIRYVGPKQVIVKDLESPLYADIRSESGYDILNVKIAPRKTSLVAVTAHTLIFIDMEKGLFNEISWEGSNGQEKFNFDTEGVCLIFTPGELSVFEYGTRSILGSVRTDYTSSHLVSVRINDRILNGSENKKLAYLIDLKTICVIDLATGDSLIQTTHRSKIDWLELNESAQMLLFRDKKQRLTLLNIEKGEKVTMLTYCNFVQWVPLSDVVVAQNRNMLNIWYNIDFTDRITIIPVQGEVIDIERGDGKTEVIAYDGINKIKIPLDDSRIEFDNSLQTCNYAQSLAFLEDSSSLESTETMWLSLGQLSIDKYMLHLAERCHAGVMDVTKAHYLRETLAIAEEDNKEEKEEALYDNYAVKARLALLKKNIKLAEAIYLEKGMVKEVIEMYQNAHKWKEALSIAEKKDVTHLNDLYVQYLQWLRDTGQDEKAGEFKEKEGDYLGAIDLYLKAGLPARAAKLVSHIPQGVGNNEDIVQLIASSLMKGEFYEHAGDLYEKMNNYHKALECYRLGNAFKRAVELARKAFPEEVVHLEEEWGDHLIFKKQPDAAANHFVESGSYLKALDAAISSRQWKQASQIIEIIDNPSKVLAFYPKLANHYLSVGEYEMAEHFFVEGGMHKEAMEMYMNAGDWEKAYKLAGQFLPSDEVNKMYINQAEKLQLQGKLKDAERLFISLGEPNKAIAMYKDVKQYDNMLQLVEQFHPEQFQEAYLILAKELEAERNFKLAEYYYLAGDNWKSAVNMYRNLDMWEEAYEVSKSYGTAVAAKQIAYLWAKSLGGESAVKLLNKFGLLESAIDYAAENCAFEFAFELAASALEEKLPDIHLKYAMFLEDEGKYQEAEIEFIKAGRPKEAVLMYVHQQNWEDAQRVAEANDKDSVADVLVGQARFAFENDEFQKAESLLLRAQRGELAVKFYKGAKMWNDALRVCKDYLPAKFAELQEEYEKDISASGTKDPGQLLIHGQEWEAAGQYAKAVEYYKQASSVNSDNHDAIEKCWLKAVELSWRSLGRQHTEEIVQQAGPKLLGIQRYSTAAQVYLKVNLVKEAIDALVVGEEWTKAKKVASEYDPRLEEYVDKRYKEYLLEQGKTDQLVNVDVIAALDVYAEQDWRKCLDIAEKQGSKVLHKYVALCASEQIKEGTVDKALKLYMEYGAPAYEQNFNIYRHIFSAVVGMCGLYTAEAYPQWADLRDVLFDLVRNLAKTDKSNEKEEFDKMLTISHYYAARSACMSQPSLGKQAAKISVILLRYITLIPADKAFYEAGLAAKEARWDSMALVFWNHFLDIHEAIEEGSPEKIDNLEFTGTDIPLVFPLPQKTHLPVEVHDTVREWILAVSVDRHVEQILPVDERMSYEASLVFGSSQYQPCVITGYPVLRNKVEFNDSNKVANKEDWNKFLMAAKVSHSVECQDVLKFVTHWCGGAPNLSYSFQ